MSRSQSTTTYVAIPPLPDRIVRLIINAPCAGLVASSLFDRTLVLPEIASLHTRKELLAIDGIGRAAIKQLEAWLAHHGRRVRQPKESLDLIICNFGLPASRAANRDPQFFSKSKSMRRVRSNRQVLDCFAD